ncbi:MAG: anti-sigma factor [Bryobacteraceae bacterium]
MLKCREVEQKIGSDEILQAGLMERLAVRMHLAMCRNCSNYLRQIRAIGEAVRKLGESHGEDPERIARLIGRITGPG